MPEREEGLDAFEEGVPLKRCPYEEGSEEAEAWVEGWKEAQDIARQSRDDVDEE